MHARQSPSGHRWRSATSPVRGGFRRGRSRLRDSARLRLPGTWPPLSFLYKERTKEISASYPKSKAPVYCFLPQQTGAYFLWLCLWLILCARQQGHHIPQQHQRAFALLHAQAEIRSAQCIIQHPMRELFHDLAQLLWPDDVTIQNQLVAALDAMPTRAAVTRTRETSTSPCTLLGGLP